MKKMKKQVNILFILILTYLTTGNILALSGISFSYGNGVAKLKPWRIGLQKTWDSKWCNQHLGPFDGYWELSAYHLTKTKQYIPENNKLSIVAITPVFRWYRNFSSITNNKFYLEFAVGAAQVNKRTIGPRKLGINFQFEDRLGFGIQFGNKKQYDFGYRVIHFSNAYLGHSNHGINLQMLYFNYWFN